MVPTRRRLLRSGGAAALAALAGCTTDSLLAEPAPEYLLNVVSIDASPVERALYEPDDESLFGAPARTALEAILPEGRHTTYGYRPLPEDAYVAHEGSYYQTASVVTGRRELPRLLVRVEPLEEAAIPEDAVLIDSLERPSARALTILATNTRADGGTRSSELLRDDAYVLRRPAERESRLATGDLDGRVVTLTEDGTWGYRVSVSRERITETAHTALAVPVADSRARFREVVFGSRIDTELAPAALPGDARDLLDEAIARGRYTETAPISEPFDAVIDALGLGGVERATNGKLLWYDERLYRYGLYIDPDP
jgi:hypothetical protein